MKIKHIAVATDLSDLSRTAQAHAITLARSFGARLTLLHVDDFAAEHELSDTAFLGQVEALRTELLGTAEQLLREWVDEVAVAIPSGRPVEEIPRFCEEQGVDLLVMARHGYRGPQPIGNSKVDGVLERVDIPVLVTPATEGDHPNTEPLDYRYILSTTDFSKDSLRGMRFAVEFARDLGAHLEVAHVLRKPFFAHLALPPAGLEQMRLSTEEKLSAELLRAGVEDATQRVTLGDHPAKSIAELIEAPPHTLVVIPTHGKHARRGLIGHTTRELIAISPAPVLTLPWAPEDDA